MELPDYDIDLYLVPYKDGIGRDLNINFRMYGWMEADDRPEQERALEEELMSDPALKSIEGRIFESHTEYHIRAIINNKLQDLVRCGFLKKLFDDKWYFSLKHWQDYKNCEQDRKEDEALPKSSGKSSLLNPGVFIRPF